MTTLSRNVAQNSTLPMDNAFPESTSEANEAIYQRMDIDDTPLSMMRILTTRALILEPYAK